MHYPLKEVRVPRLTVMEGHRKRFHDLQIPWGAGATGPDGWYLAEYFFSRMEKLNRLAPTSKTPAIINGTW